ncbi:flavodoxin [Sutterella sp.]|uniref:flavodoxin n=1 Tax=Sutterella sp. TaxID=1981025 RepID=UPI0026DF2969|nr:flavodoxin [Sutterella sp.]MDO5531856.1 flavodoxin [Sutterella sp.]
MQRRTLLRHAAAAATAAGVTFTAGSVSAADNPKRVLIVIYSRRGEEYAPGGAELLDVGHTERMARVIAKVTGGELLRIDTVKAYPVNYREMTEVAQEELNANARPELSTPIPDMSKYDTVFIGHPIWWSEMPMAMRTFLDKVDLSGKKVAHFTTHAGSGLGSSDRTLRRVVKGAEFLEPLAITGRQVDASEARITSWVKSLGF